MLVLTRKLKECVVVGANIRVTVLAVKGNQVRLGFEAPANVAILRQELCFDVPAFEPCKSGVPCST